MHNLKRYFAIFDVFRFFAFLKVFLFHLPIVAFPAFSFIKAGGEVGVSFFFVLSGFLITYFLLSEKKEKGHIQLRNFFARRILRIWPLYYLMIAFAFYTPFIIDILGLSYSNEGYKPNWWLSILFLENYEMIFKQDSPNVSPLAVMWTLCVEEHFYIVWGVALYFIKVTRVPVLIAVSIAVAMISRFVFVSYGWPTIDLFTNIDLFAFGALPAYWLVMHPQKLKSNVQRIPLIIQYLLILVVVIIAFWLPNAHYTGHLYFNPLLQGIIFSLLLFITTPDNAVMSVNEKNWLARLGIYTYGLYMYHTIVINLFVQLFKKIGASLQQPAIAFIFGALSIVITVLISWLSYFLFERYFLRLKKYFY